jgi:hypothetical protein
MITKKFQKSSYDFICESCDYKTCKLSQYERHLSTNKHKKITNDNTIGSNSSIQCKCGKQYKFNSGLSRHKKTCDYNETENKNESNNNDIILTFMQEQSDLKNLVIEVMKNNNELQKQNGELQKQVLDVCKNIQPNITNNHTNSHNKTFNLQFFLNEQCKDAMNISDFIKSVTLSIQDLERVGTHGYVEGISSIIIKELRNLDIHKRPMHCSDTKRETLYIKDEDKWEKEDHENKKIKNVIKSVEHKNIKMINEWTKEHSAYKASNDKDNDKYLNIVLEAAGGIGDYEEKGNKIIKKIAKEVAIDK